MFVRRLNRDILSLAGALSQLRDFAWIDSADGGGFSVMVWEPDRREVFLRPDDRAAFSRFLSSFPADRGARTEFKFSSGWIGYVAYEAYAYSDQIPLRPEALKDYPLAVFCHYAACVTVNDATEEVFFVAPGINGEALFRQFLHIIEKVPPKPEPVAAKPPRLGIDKARYDEDFATVKESLSAGDYFELNYTVPFSSRYEGDPLPLYLSLRETAPAPFMAFLNFEEVSVLSASPECFFACEGGILRSHPIKGTVKREADPFRDEAAKTALLNSAKDRSELLMVADMVRSDLGRVCKNGTVRAEKLAELKTFSHCHHLVATLAGDVAAGKTLADVFHALFPGGSITGAPKIKVMERISTLEKRPRGIYTGALGLIADTGFTEFNIPIRTLTLQKGRIEFAAGGGLTIESDLESEFAECLVKAATIGDCLGKIGRV